MNVLFRHPALDAGSIAVMPYCLRSRIKCGMTIRECGMMVFFFALLCFAATEASAQTSAQQYAKHVISVSGQAKEEIDPDQAILSISLVSRDMELDKAKRENDRITKKVVSALRDFDIPKEKIANSHFRISPQYRYEQKHKKQILTGYIVNRSLRVTMDDISIHERVISKLVELKVDHVGGVQYTLKDREAKADRVREKAYKNAKSRALTIVKAAGMRLGKPLNISVSGGYTPAPMPGMARDMVAMEHGGSVAPTLPGLITISESVNVVFEME